MNAYQWFSLAAIALALATWLVYFGLVPAWNEARKIASLPRIQQIFVVLFTFGMIHSAVTKPDFRFDGGIKQGANASWATNDTIHIEWQRDLSTGVYVPETAAVYIDYRPNTETNAEWGLLAQTTVGAWSWEGTLADATNYDYNVWAYYIPPEPVHTNGVWVYKTMKDRPNQYIIPLRAHVEVNGKAISTPLAKRREEKPYDAEVEYIESSGEQYIDTGYHITDSSSMKIECQYVSGADCPLFGIFASGANYNNRLVLAPPRTIYYVLGGLSQVTTTFSGEISARHTYENGKSGVYVDGARVKSYAHVDAFVAPKTVLIFTNWSASGIRTPLAKVIVFSFEIAENGVAAMKLTPVRFTNERGESEGAMYDRVSRQLFRNSGTGAFIIGPDK